MKMAFGAAAGLWSLAFLCARAQTPAQGNPQSKIENPKSEIQVISPAAIPFDHAQLLFGQQQYAAALAEYSTVIRDFPNDSRREEALYKIADCYRLLNRPQDALAAYRFQSDAYPDSPFYGVVRLRIGEMLLTQKKYAEAVPLLTQAREKGNAPVQAAAQYSLGLALLETGRTDDGRKWLADLVESSSQSETDNQKNKITYAAPAALALAASLEKEGKLPDALRIWQKLLTLAPGNLVQSQAAARGGYIALQIGNAKEAEALFETCRRIDPKSDWRRVANTGLLRLYFEQSRWDDLVGLYNTERAALLDSARGDILYEVAHAQSARKSWPEAESALTVFLREFPRHPLALTAAYERLLARAAIDPDNLHGDTAAYLAAYPDSPHVPAVQLLRARDFSRRGDFAGALPMWETLAATPPEGASPGEIFLEKARAHFELKQWLLAAEAYGAYLSRFSNADAKIAVAATARQAMALQNAQQFDAALTAWNQVRKLALPGSSELQTALEQAGLLQVSLKNNPAAAETFRELLDKFPQTKIRALATFIIGDDAYNRRQWDDARPWLLEARKTDPGTYQIPASQRLAWVGYQLRQPDAAAGFVNDYETAVKNDPKAARLPVSLYYWLGDTFLNRGDFMAAAGNLEKVTRHPDAGKLLGAAWWSLARAQRELHQWDDSIASIEKLRQLNSGQAGASIVLLALARAQLGKGALEVTEKLINQVLIQDAEGPQNAEARELLGEVFVARKDYAGAAKAFSALALLYNDPQVTPRAMQRAAEAYALAGNQIAAAEWRAKLRDRYPDYKP